ncbi:hypothetical protein H5410_019866 [Solanum commersonii]|uniref:Uncharacterized protein n=1 Tax=Solanum commersonii TaxID=4109 RepID=A0A9J5Z6T9_SOLCO|nr:hypothetical protein H5410_019866 [Solanum commersonii]
MRQKRRDTSDEGLPPVTAVLGWKNWGCVENERGNYGDVKMATFAFFSFTWDFGEVAGSMSKSNAMQEIRSKLKNDPIRRK